MLNMVLDYMRENNITEKIGLMVLDNEANYDLSLKFMHKIIQANLDLLDVYWCCLPITLPCTVSSFMTEWQCWGEDDRDRWIRPMPENDYVVNVVWFTYHANVPPTGLGTVNFQRHGSGWPGHPDGL